MTGGKTPQPICTATDESLLPVSFSP